MIEIPVFQQTNADFVQDVNLAKQLMTVRITYDIRNCAFHLTITDDFGGEIKGIKMVPRWPLLRQNRGQIVFSGDFLILRGDIAAENIITYDNLGSGWKLYYLTADQMQEWSAENGL